MNFQDIKISNIHIDDHLNIKYKNAKNIYKKLILKTPILFIPFGIDKVNDNYFIKLQARKNNNTPCNVLLDSFIEFIYSIESLFKNKFNKEVRSNIFKSDKYDDLIKVKVISKHNKILSVIKYSESFYNFYKISKGDSCICDILIEKIWVYNNIIYYTIQIKYLRLIKDNILI